MAQHERRPKTSAIRTSSSTGIAAWRRIRTATKPHNYDGCFARPDSVLVYDYPNTTASGEWYHSAYLNDSITIDAQADVERRRSLRPLFELPARAGQSRAPARSRPRTSSRTRARTTTRSTASFVPRVSAVYDLTGQGRIAVRASYGRYVGGSSGASANPGPGADRRQPERDHHADLLELGRQHSVCAGRGEPDVDDRRRHQSRDRSRPQGTVRRRIHRRPRRRPQPRR